MTVSEIDKAPSFFSVRLKTRMTINILSLVLGLCIYQGIGSISSKMFWRNWKDLICLGNIFKSSIPYMRNQRFSSKLLDFKNFQNIAHLIINQLFFVPILHIHKVILIPTNRLYIKFVIKKRSKQFYRQYYYLY